MERFIELYFVHPSYYKIDNKPVFMIYDLANLMKGLGGTEPKKKALDWFRVKVVEAGFPGLHLQMTLWGDLIFNLSGVDDGITASTCKTNSLLGFDSISNYQLCHFVDIDRDYNEIIEDVIEKWRFYERTYDIPYFRHISLGWDNNPRFQGFRPGIIKKIRQKI